MADKYKPAAILGTGLVLVRASTGHSEAKELGEDFGLSEVMVKWFREEHKLHMKVRLLHAQKKPLETAALHTDSLLSVITGV